MPTGAESLPAVNGGNPVASKWNLANPRYCGHSQRVQASAVPPAKTDSPPAPAKNLHLEQYSSFPSRERGVHFIPLSWWSLSRTRRGSAKYCKVFGHPVADEFERRVGAWILVCRTRVPDLTVAKQAPIIQGQILRSSTSRNRHINNAMYNIRTDSLNVASQPDYLRFVANSASAPFERLAALAFTALLF